MNPIESGILKALITGTAATQPALAKELNINQSTVSRRLEALIAGGLVRHVGANKGYALVASVKDTVDALAQPHLDAAREWLDLANA